MPHYEVLQVVLKEKLLGTGSANLTQLESVINAKAAEGCRLHMITTASSGSEGLMGGDRIQATMVFESWISRLVVYRKAKLVRAYASMNRP